MFTELTKDRRKALQLLAEHIRFSSTQLSLQSVIYDIKEDDMKWVTEKIHYYLLRLLEDSEPDTNETESLEIIDSYET
tara:strand:- start:3472 stop:3705 length:234 start_codon:yes stop_codon:yes gene_type:complete